MSLEDLQQASRLLVQALRIRERYMELSFQSFPPLASRFLRSFDSQLLRRNSEIVHEDKKTIKGVCVCKHEKFPVVENLCVRVYSHVGEREANRKVQLKVKCVHHSLFKINKSLDKIHI